MKFCNNLENSDGTSFVAELTIGQARLKATTATCSPAVGLPCAAIPSGTSTLTLQETVGNQTLTLAMRTLTIQPGVEYVAFAEIDEATDREGIFASPLSAELPGVQCSLADYDDFYDSYDPVGGAEVGAPSTRWRVSAPDLKQESP